MKDPEKAYRRRVRVASLGFWLARRASRNRTLGDRVARSILGWLLQPVEGQEDLVVAHPGYDAEELARYERGETRG